MGLFVHVIKSKRAKALYLLGWWLDIRIYMAAICEEIARYLAIFMMLREAHE